MKEFLDDRAKVNLEGLSMNDLELLKSALVKAEKWDNFMFDTKEFVIGRENPYLEAPRSPFEPMPKESVALDWGAGLKLIVERYILEP